MNRHIVTIVLLSISLVLYLSSSFVGERYQKFFEIGSYILPIIAALWEIIIAVRSGKKTQGDISDLKDKQLTFRVEDETLFIENKSN